MSACRTGSGACCRSCSRTSCRSARATATSGSGFVYESARRDRPIGTTKANGRFGVDLVGLNCATCHAGTYRDAPRAPRQVVLGMPAHQMDLQGYARFLTACAKDPRFNADTLIEAIEKSQSRLRLLRRPRLPVLRRRAATRDGILERAQRDTPGSTSGRRRARARRHVQSLQGDVRVRHDHRRHASAPPICRRSGTSGCGAGCGCTGTATTTLVEERNKSAAIGAGATPESLDLAALGAHRGLDPRPQAAGVSGGAHRRRARRRGPAWRMQALARAATTSAAATVGQVTTARRDRHRSRARCDPSRPSWPCR